MHYRLHCSRLVCDQVTIHFQAAIAPKYALASRDTTPQNNIHSHTLCTLKYNVNALHMRSEGGNDSESSSMRSYRAVQYDTPQHTQIYCRLRQ